MIHRARSAQALPSEQIRLSVLLATQGLGSVFRRGCTHPASHREPHAPRRVLLDMPPALPGLRRTAADPKERPRRRQP
ncbi:hypothetical protein NDU88_000428 [Pleurodeles waltl]|uniref:Uncharacterized protein n=1 Tax=Pleurodeles waltl TaxID=8319 RepID=A0AAV7U5D2_PLEWA|nr:hypothetical protein NDU88_000428 [Pleurodeles waltl]